MKYCGSCNCRTVCVRVAVSLYKPRHFMRGSNPDERAEALLARDGGFALSSALFSLAWHTFWRSLTCRLFERSSADINTFERLTRLRSESLCARNIRPVAHADGIVPGRKSSAFVPFRIYNRDFFAKRRSRTLSEHISPFSRTKVFGRTRALVANTHTIMVISLWIELFRGRSKVIVRMFF